MSKHWEQNKDATVYVGNIDERFTQELLSELMTQVGPVRQVHMPQDRVSQTHQGYGFVEFDTPQSADYASKVFNGIRVWGKPIRVNKASADKQKAVDIGAELFINNLDPQVDEKILYDTFSQFGQILRQPNIVRDENNISKGYGFVSFDSFEASDAARGTMNGQYLLSKTITVEYAYKKDGKGERHGDEAERKLAAEGKKHNIIPEQQTLPPAFHMTGPAPSAAAAAAVSPAAAAPVAAVPPAGALGAVPPVAPFVPATAAMPPAPVAPALGMPPAAPYGVPPVAPPAGFPAGFGGRGGPLPYAGRGAHPVGLPPAPTGLPARPPPSHAGYGGPPGGPPFRGSPVGGAPIAPPPVGPPAGFPGAGIPPPGGFPPMPPGFMAPPPGAAPPPGFGAPGGPPGGYVRR
ncbi:putative spliceosome-associated protein SAP-49 [Diplogelasinospora grovesii]|uniref:Spliceosome-associated protein SAP-49 n=1 Tax=Diplogelasinospora grovesii TaxID=303347 RepID=A0AAN6NES6_9PEZI|nr:putative spliceosome-associated protein SAP-49 [Diplogelasinospora grovesii]